VIGLCLIYAVGHDRDQRSRRAQQQAAEREAQERIAVIEARRSQRAQHKAIESLNEQLERDDCVKWVRVVDMDPVLELACNIPDSRIRVALRNRKAR